MPKKYRYTCQNPPAEVLRKFPNWVQALDEEGLPGQDETTIKPDKTQDRVAETTQHTAADAFLCDGTSCPALLCAWKGLWEGVVEAVSIYKGEWAVEIKGSRWVPDYWRLATRQHGDTTSFPLHVVSRLPSAKTGKPIELWLLPDGSVGT